MSRRPGAYAVTTGVPSASVDRSTVKWSMETAMWAGSTRGSLQWKVDPPVTGPSRPMDTTLKSSGTVAARWNDAVSWAFSWTGNHAEELPSNAVAPPEVVGSQPPPGVPSYSTRTRNPVPRRIVAAGAMTSSPSVWVKDARRPSTVTERTAGPLSWRVTRSSASVAVALTTVTPWSVPVSGR